MEAQCFLNALVSLLDSPTVPLKFLPENVRNVTTMQIDSHRLSMSVKQHQFPAHSTVFLVVPAWLLFYSAACCCACEVRSITRDSVFISPPPGRRVRGHLFNWPILAPVLWQGRRYRRAHCTGRALALHFPQWRRKVLKWKSGPPSVFQEASLRRPLAAAAAMRR